jgi:hypothetical protein
MNTKKENKTVTWRMRVTPKFRDTIRFMAKLLGVSQSDAVRIVIDEKMGGKKVFIKANKNA